MTERLNPYEHVQRAIRDAYVVQEFHHDRTFSTEVMVRQRARRLGSWEIADETIMQSPQGFIPYKAKVWADGLVDADLDKLPWEEFYE